MWWTDQNKTGQSLRSIVTVPTTSTAKYVAVLPWLYVAEMGTVNSLHASA